MGRIPADRRTLPMQIDISRCSSNEREDFITVRLTDRGSSISFVEVEVSMADFAAAVTGHGAIPCTGEVRGLQLVGTTHEAKTVVVPGLTHETWKVRAQLVAEYEVDGWKADMAEGMNHHRVRGVDGYEVWFHRYV